MTHSKRWPRWPLWSLCVLLLPVAALSQGRGDVSRLSDGVVVAAQQGLVFVMHEGGGIDAIELASGAVRWHSDAAAKPLALAGDHLVAQADGRAAQALDIVAIDLRSGAARSSARVALPAGVTASAVKPPGGSFEVRAEPRGSQLVLAWQATGTAAGAPLQGITPAEDRGAPVMQDGQAAVSVVDSRLSVQPLSDMRAAAGDSSAQPALEELITPAVKAEGRQWLSSDGRHVLVSSAVQRSEFSPYRYRWTIYDRASGARLGAVQALVSATPFVVVGNVLYHVTPSYAAKRDDKMVQHPKTLHAVNLATGAEVWRAAIVDTEFRGPYPS